MEWENEVECSREASREDEFEKENTFGVVLSPYDSDVIMCIIIRTRRTVIAIDLCCSTCTYIHSESPWTSRLHL